MSWYSPYEDPERQRSSMIAGGISFFAIVIILLIAIISKWL